METLKKNQIKIPWLKSLIIELKNSLDKLKNWLGMSELKKRLKINIFEYVEKSREIKCIFLKMNRTSGNYEGTWGNSQVKAGYSC